MTEIEITSFLKKALLSHVYAFHFDSKYIAIKKIITTENYLYSLGWFKLLYLMYTRVIVSIEQL